MGANNSKKKSKSNLKKAKTSIEDIEDPMISEEIKAEIKNPVKLLKYIDIEECEKLFFKLEEKSEKINYLKYIDFNDYMISLSKFSLKNADIHDNYTKIKLNYSSNDYFYNETFNIESLQSFLESKILKHPLVYEKAFHSGKSQERSYLFKDFIFNIHKALIPKIKQIELENGVSEDEINENTIMKKCSAIIYGLLFCRGDDWVKVRIFFHLFKDENDKLKKSQALDFFFFMLFTAASYGMCFSRNKISNYKKMGKVEEDDFAFLMKIFTMDQTKSLVEYIDTLLFGKENLNELVYEQFKNRCEIDEKKDSASFIFSSMGIRYMYKKLSGIESLPKNNSKKKK